MLMFTRGSVTRGHDGDFILTSLSCSRLTHPNSSPPPPADRVSGLRAYSFISPRVLSLFLYKRYVLCMTVAGGIPVD